MIETKYQKDGSLTDIKVEGDKLTHSVNNSQNEGLSKLTPVSSYNRVSHGGRSSSVEITSTSVEVSSGEGSTESTIEVTQDQITVKSANPLTHESYVAPSADHDYVQKKYVDTEPDGKLYLRSGDRWIESKVDTKIAHKVIEVTGPTDYQFDQPYQHTPIILHNSIEGSVMVSDITSNKVHLSGRGKIQLVIIGV